MLPAALPEPAQKLDARLPREKPPPAGPGLIVRVARIVSSDPPEPIRDELRRPALTCHVPMVLALYDRRLRAAFGDPLVVGIRPSIVAGQRQRARPGCPRRERPAGLTNAIRLGTGSRVSRATRPGARLVQSTREPPGQHPNEPHERQPASRVAAKRADDLPASTPPGLHPSFEVVQVANRRVRHDFDATLSHGIECTAAEPQRRRGTAARSRRDPGR